MTARYVVAAAIAVQVVLLFSFYKQAYLVAGISCTVSLILLGVLREQVVHWQHNLGEKIPAPQAIEVGVQEMMIYGLFLPTLLCGVSLLNSISLLDDHSRYAVIASAVVFIAIALREFFKRIKL